MARLETSIPSSSSKTSPTSPTTRRSGADNDARHYFDLSLLEPTTLTLDSLPRSLQQLEDHLDVTSVTFIVSQALRLYCALEYILSGTCHPTRHLPNVNSGT